MPKSERKIDLKKDQNSSHLPISEEITHQLSPVRQNQKKIRTYVEDFKAPQALVHTQHNLSLRQHRLWLFLMRSFSIYHRKTRELSDVAIISMAEIRKGLKLRMTIDEIIAELDQLFKGVLTINVLKKQSDNDIFKLEKFATLHYISDYSVIDKDTDQAQFSFSLSHILRELMCSDEFMSRLFTLFSWQLFINIRGKHDSTIYLLCKDYANIGRTPVIQMETFRGYLGVSTDSYADQKSFVRSCITYPVKALNEMPDCDLHITAEIRYEKCINDRRKSHAVSIQFIIQKIKPALEHQPELIDVIPDTGERSDLTSTGMAAQSASSKKVQVRSAAPMDNLERILLKDLQQLCPTDNYTFASIEALAKANQKTWLAQANSLKAAAIQAKPVRDR